MSTNEHTKISIYCHIYEKRETDRHIMVKHSKKVVVPMSLECKIRNRQSYEKKHRHSVNRDLITEICMLLFITGVVTVSQIFLTYSFPDLLGLPLSKFVMACKRK